MAFFFYFWYDKKRGVKMTNKGYTLVELMAVLIILALLVLIAVPVFITGFDRGRTSTENMAQDMIRAAAMDFAATESPPLNQPINLCKLYETGYIALNLENADGRIIDYCAMNFRVTMENGERVIRLNLLPNNEWRVRTSGENSCPC